MKRGTIKKRVHETIIESKRSMTVAEVATAVYRRKPSKTQWSYIDQRLRQMEKDQLAKRVKVIRRGHKVNAWICTPRPSQEVARGLGKARVPIATLELSVRTATALSNAGLKWVDELVEADLDRLSLPRKAQREIQIILSSMAEEEYQAALVLAAAAQSSSPSSVWTGDGKANGDPLYFREPPPPVLIDIPGLVSRVEKLEQQLAEEIAVGAQAKLELEGLEKRERDATEAALTGLRALRGKNEFIRRVEELIASIDGLAEEEPDRRPATNTPWSIMMADRRRQFVRDCDVEFCQPGIKIVHLIQCCEVREDYGTGTRARAYDRAMQSLSMMVIEDMGERRFWDTYR